MRKLILIVFGLPIILMAGVMAIQGAYTDSVTGANPVVETDDTINVTHGETYELADSNLDGVVYFEESNVTVDQAGTTYDADGNWTWHRGNGTISIANTSDLTENEDANVSAGYHEAQNEQVAAKDVAMFPLGLGDTIQLVAMVALLLGSAVIFGRTR